MGLHQCHLPDRAYTSRCQGTQCARLARTNLRGTGQGAPWQPAHTPVARPSQARLWFQCRHQHVCPIASANTDNIPAEATPATRDKRFLSPEGELGEKSWGPGGVGGKEEKRGGFLKLPWRPHPRTKGTKGIKAHFYVCSNITKDRRSGLSCPGYAPSRNSPWT